TLVSHLHQNELHAIVSGYATDPYFKNIRDTLRQGSGPNHILKLPFFENEQGLLYFEDWNRDERLCVPRNEQVRIIAKCHNELTNGAHAG
ncbi:hypothetical protein M422DRAFT_103096, partial [Sphaerobolus stellatus SS14]